MFDAAKVALLASPLYAASTKAFSAILFSEFEVIAEQLRVRCGLVLT